MKWQELPPEQRDVFERMQDAFTQFLHAMHSYDIKYGHPPSRPLDRGDPGVREILTALDKVRELDKERDRILGRQSEPNK